MVKTEGVSARVLYLEVINFHSVITSCFVKITGVVYTDGSQVILREEGKTVYNNQLDTLLTNL